MADDKTHTKYPQGKHSVNINKEKYSIVRKAILNCIKGRELTHAQLSMCASGKLHDFNGSTQWYIETVKLDLEARGEIKRKSDVKPHLYWQPGKGLAQAE